MKSVNKLQLGIILAAIVLFVLLYFANKKPVKKAEDVVAQTGQSIGTVELKVFVEAKTAALNDSLKKKYSELENAIAKAADKNAALDSMVKFWDRQMLPDVASAYVEKQAELAKKSTAWFTAGERYYYAVRFVKDVNEVAALYQRAIHCYSKGLELEPGSVEAKIRLAACYVEGTADPMKGISILKEVEKTDSNNVNLQLNFAMFSAKSQQWDKAIARFEKVLKLKPDYLEAYLYLADAYEKSGNTEKTIEALQKYVDLVPSKDEKKEISKYIEKLKNNH
ncbi:MAG: tetratricopeptide repeat protein [Bacteroidia bacterium]